MCLWVLGVRGFGVRVRVCNIVTICVGVLFRIGMFNFGQGLGVEEV